MPNITFDKIVIKTDRAVLIQVNEYQTWLPLKHVKIKKNTVEVPDWLHVNLDWKEDESSIEYVCHPDDNRVIRQELEDACWKKR